MRGKRITEEMRKKILYLSQNLHYSEPSIVKKLGIPKTNVQRVIAESRPQSVQHSAEPKVQIHNGVISNDQRRDKGRSSEAR